MRSGLLRGGKIAILVPSYNGGSLLEETVMSAARAGLPLDSYEIIVSDNASTDGSVAALPPQDIQGAPIAVRRNEANLGRINNWNGALVAAEEMGFSYALFLMVGDVLVGRTILVLRERMARQGALLGLASFQLANESLRPVRIARRICWRGDPESGTTADRFLSQSVAWGAMLFAPLGANLYRIDAGVRLRFDPGDETHTDHLATALFAREGARPIVYLDSPVSAWRRRPGRFHSSMTVHQRLAGDLRVMECVCRASCLPLDLSRVRASLMLRGTVLCRGDLRRAWCLARDLSGKAPISWSWLARLILRLVRDGTPWLVEG